jgi:hypothetical protein
MFILQINIKDYGSSWGRGPKKIDLERAYKLILALQDKSKKLISDSCYQIQPYSITFSTLSIFASVYLPDVA